MTPIYRPAGAYQRILVVADDPLFRQMSARTLLRSGYAVDTAEDGAAGWAALQVRDYDLLLTDYDMPKATGMELVRKIWSAQMALPVILVSAILPTEELERDPWLKPVAAMSKPIFPNELLGVVELTLDEFADAGATIPVAAAVGYL
jgi:CheY-like chemotaxis protein